MMHCYDFMRIVLGPACGICPELLLLRASIVPDKITLLRKDYDVERGPRCHTVDELGSRFVGRLSEERQSK